MHVSLLALLAASALATPAPVRRACDTPCRRAGADAYIKALTTHTKADAAAVPLTDDVKRFETFNGVGPFQTSASATDMRLSLQYGASALAYRAYEQAYTAFDNGTLLVEYKIDTGLLNGAVPIPGATTRIHEYFQYADALISRIDVFTHTPA